MDPEAGLGAAGAESAGLGVVVSGQADQQMDRSTQRHFLRREQFALHQMGPQYVVGFEPEVQRDQTVSVPMVLRRTGTLAGLRQTDHLAELGNQSC